MLFNIIVFIIFALGLFLLKYVLDNNSSENYDVILPLAFGLICMVITFAFACYRAVVYFFY